MHLRYALLALLGESEAHGYELLQRFNRRIGPFRHPNIGHVHRNPKHSLYHLRAAWILALLGARLGVELGARGNKRQQSLGALASEVDLACEDAFGFAGERCDRIVARVMERLAGEEGR